MILNHVYLFLVYLTFILLRRQFSFSTRSFFQYLFKMFHAQFCLNFFFSCVFVCFLICFSTDNDFNLDRLSVNYVKSISYIAWVLLRYSILIKKYYCEKLNTFNSFLIHQTVLFNSFLCMPTFRVSDLANYQTMCLIVSRRNLISFRRASHSSELRMSNALRQS